MHLLPKPIRKEECIFYSDSPRDALQRTMQQQLNGYYINLSGTCSAEGIFKISLSKTIFYVTVNRTRQPAVSLHGKIDTDMSNRTVISCSVRPHYILIIFFFLFPMVGIAVLVHDLLNDNNNIGSFMFAAGFIAVPVGLLWFTHFAKKQLKETFEKAFDLRQE